MFPSTIWSACEINLAQLQLIKGRKNNLTLAIKRSILDGKAAAKISLNHYLSTIYSSSTYFPYREERRGEERRGEERRGEGRGGEGREEGEERRGGEGRGGACNPYVQTKAKVTGWLT